MYEDSIVPAHASNGGGFSFMIFTLRNLYYQHQYIRNIWTHTNQHLPLVKYLGCSIKLFQSQHLDYLFRYKNDHPIETQMLSYTSSQPSVMSMLNNTIRMPSKDTAKHRKQYKKIFIKPPPVMKKQWYFQHDLANIPLLMTQTAATSFDQFYIAYGSESTNITIPTLNTQLFQNRLFNHTYSTGYPASTSGTRSIFLWASYSENPVQEIELGDLIFLGETKRHQKGTEWKKTPGAYSTWKAYREQRDYWGNPFYTDFLTGSARVFQSQKNIQTMATDTETDKHKKALEITELVKPIILYVRYSPNRDSGENNSITMLSNSQSETGWALPQNTNQYQTGFPAWLSVWGFVDFLKKIKLLTRPDTDYMVLIKNTTTDPLFQNLVPLDDDFINGNSPQQEGVNPWDADKWYPQTQYQENALNNIALCGPGVPKLDWRKTLEAKFQYTFYFKFGGNTAPMADIHDPRTLPYFVMPSNEQQTTSLQNPESPVEIYLQSFDQRRDELTKQALQRITKDYSIKTDSLQSQTGLSMHETGLQKAWKQTETSEEEETTLQEQLQQQFQQQQLIRQRINNLLSKLQSIE